MYTFANMKKDTISFKIDPETKAILDSAAKKKQWTLSLYMENVAKAHVKRHLKTKNA